MTDNKKDNLLSQIRFAYKKPLVLGEHPPEERKTLEYWIDRFIDEEVSRYSIATIAQVFSHHEYATKLLLVYLEKQGAIEDSGIKSEEREKLRALLKD